MSLRIVVLVLIAATLLNGCTPAEGTESSAPADSSGESREQSAAVAEPRWRRIALEEQEAIGIDQLVESELGFGKWEWTLRDDERLFRPNSPTYEGLILQNRIAEIRVWNSNTGDEPSRDDRADAYTFDDAGRLAMRRSYSEENGYSYERFGYDGDRLVLKETRSSPTNVGWDQADVVEQFSLRFDYYAHPGFPERRYRIARSFDDVVQRIEYEIQDGDRWEYWFDDYFGDPVSVILTVTETGAVLLGEFRRVSSRIQSRIRIAEIGGVEGEYETAYASQRAGNREWTELTSTRYKYREQPFALISSETKDEDTGDSFGTVEYRQHDDSGNWLRAEGSSGVLVVREIDYR